MKIETYGGSCPSCTKSMFQRWESRTGGISFDACPWCASAYGERDGIRLSAHTIWNIVFFVYAMDSRSDLIKRLRLDTHVPYNRSAFYPAVFVHKKSRVLQLG